MLCGNKAYSCWVVNESRTGHHCIPELAALQVVFYRYCLYSKSSNCLHTDIDFIYLRN